MPLRSSSLQQVLVMAFETYTDFNQFCSVDLQMLTKALLSGMQGISGLMLMRHKHILFLTEQHYSCYN